MHAKRKKLVIDSFEAESELNYLDEFGLSTRHEMESKFNEFCSEYGAKSLYNDIKFQSFTSEKGNHSYTIDSPVNSALGLGNLISQTFSDQISYTEGEKPRSPSRRVTNTFTWNIFDEKTQQYFLVIRELIMFRFFKEYGISTSVLTSFATKEEKEKYIMECMRKSVAEDLKEFSKRHNSKLSQIKKFEESFVRDMEKFIYEKSDVFKWLKIRTK
jgi:hypothetical protein